MSLSRCIRNCKLSRETRSFVFFRGGTFNPAAGSHVVALLLFSPPRARAFNIFIRFQFSPQDSRDFPHTRARIQISTTAGRNYAKSRRRVSRCKTRLADKPLCSVSVTLLTGAEEERERFTSNASIATGYVKESQSASLLFELERPGLYGTMPGVRAKENRDSKGHFCQDFMWKRETG